MIGPLKDSFRYALGATNGNCSPNSPQPQTNICSGNSSSPETQAGNENSSSGSPSSQAGDGNASTSSSGNNDSNPYSLFGDNNSKSHQPSLGVDTSLTGSPSSRGAGRQSDNYHLLPNDPISSNYKPPDEESWSSADVERALEKIARELDRLAKDIAKDHLIEKALTRVFGEWIVKHIWGPYSVLRDALDPTELAPPKMDEGFYPGDHVVPRSVDKYISSFAPRCEGDIDLGNLRSRGTFLP